MKSYTRFYAQAITNPVELFRTIDHRHSPESLVLVVVTGIVTGLSRYVSDLSTSDSFWMWILKLGLIVIPVIGTMIATVLAAALLNLVASIFRAGDDGVSIRIALPFTFIPSIIITAISLFVQNDEAKLYLNGFGGLWAFVLTTLMISSIKRISYVKSAVVAIGATLFVALPFIIIFSLFGLMK